MVTLDLVRIEERLDRLFDGHEALAGRSALQDDDLFLCGLQMGGSPSSSEPLPRASSSGTSVSGSSSEGEASAFFDVLQQNSTEQETSSLEYSDSLVGKSSSDFEARLDTLIGDMEKARSPVSDEFPETLFSPRASQWNTEAGKRRRSSIEEPTLSEITNLQPFAAVHQVTGEKSTTTMQQLSRRADVTLFEAVSPRTAATSSLGSTPKGAISNLLAARERLLTCAFGEHMIARARDKESSLSPGPLGSLPLPINLTKHPQPVAKGPNKAETNSGHDRNGTSNRAANKLETNTYHDRNGMSASAASSKTGGNGNLIQDKDLMDLLDRANAPDDAAKEETRTELFSDDGMKEELGALVSIHDELRQELESADSRAKDGGAMSLDIFDSKPTESRQVHEIQQPSESLLTQKQEKVHEIQQPSENQLLQKQMEPGDPSADFECEQQTGSRRLDPSSDSGKLQSRLQDDLRPVIDLLRDEMREEFMGVIKDELQKELEKPFEEDVKTERGTAEESKSSERIQASRVGSEKDPSSSQAPEQTSGSAKENIGENVKAPVPRTEDCGESRHQREASYEDHPDQGRPPLVIEGRGVVKDLESAMSVMHQLRKDLETVEEYALEVATAERERILRNAASARRKQKLKKAKTEKRKKKGTVAAKEHVKVPPLRPNSSAHPPESTARQGISQSENPCRTQTSPQSDARVGTQRSKKNGSRVYSQKNKACDTLGNIGIEDNGDDDVIDPVFDPTHHMDSTHHVDSSRLRANRRLSLRPRQATAETTSNDSVSACESQSVYAEEDRSKDGSDASSEASTMQWESDYTASHTDTTEVASVSTSISNASNKRRISKRNSKNWPLYQVNSNRKVRFAESHEEFLFHSEDESDPPANKVPSTRAQEPNQEPARQAWCTSLEEIFVTLEDVVDSFTFACGKRAKVDSPRSIRKRLNCEPPREASKKPKPKWQLHHDSVSSTTVEVEEGIYSVGSTPLRPRRSSSTSFGRT